METLNEGLTFLNTHPDVTFTLGVLGIIIVILGLRQGWGGYLIQYRGKVMKRRERRELVRLQAVDDFVSSVEDRVANEEFSRSEATELYTELKRIFPIKSLFPSNQWLKDKIRSRLGNHVTPNFPDKKEKKKGKNLFAKA